MKYAAIPDYSGIFCIERKKEMINLKNKIRKIGAGFMAGLCAFSMLGTGIGTAVQTKAANTITTENSAFPSADEVIAQAATLLGSPYGWCSL